MFGSAVALGPKHISYYQLTLEPGTVFHSRPPPLPDDEAAWEIQTAGQRLLADAGYVQYEISAYALEDARCRHNFNYWLFGDYVGIGAGAHGKLTFAAPNDLVRTEKPRQPRDYLDRFEASESAGTAETWGARRRVPPAELPFEFMLNALRLNDGFTIRDFEQRTGLVVEIIEPALQHARGRGLVANRGRLAPD
jgi:coproporphyrinogen III oxidase-like Fe-S oxidoreductase